MILERVSNAGFKHFMKTITLRRAQQMCAASSERMRQCSSQNVNQKEDTNMKTADFKTIYSFAYIQPARFLCRFKVYQTGIVTFLHGPRHMYWPGRCFYEGGMSSRGPSPLTHTNFIRRDYVGRGLPSTIVFLLGLSLPPAVVCAAFSCQGVKGLKK